MRGLLADLDFVTFLVYGTAYNLMLTIVNAKLELKCKNKLKYVTQMCYHLIQTQNLNLNAKPNPNVLLKCVTI